MQWLLTHKVWLLNTRKVHLAHFLKKVDIVRFNSKPSILTPPEISQKKISHPLPENFSTPPPLFLSISFPSLFKKKSENFGGGSPLKYALVRIVIVKLIISGKQFNYWQRHHIFGILKHH